MCVIIIRPNDDSWIVLGRSAMCGDYIMIREWRTLALRVGQTLTTRGKKKSIIYISD